LLVAQLVNEFISAHHPEPVCDGCIVKGAKLYQPAQAGQITTALGTTTDFVRELGECSICGAQRKVIRAVRTRAREAA
jgi:ribosomal protein S14